MGKERDGRKPQPAGAGERAVSGRTPGWAWGGAAAAVAIGALLRLRGLGAAGLWTDELVSWWAASSRSIGDLLSRCSECMATPPGAFVLQHVSVAAFGKSEWALRLPSALAGVAAIVVLFLAGRRLFGAEAGAVAALLLAIHPAHLWFSTDARPYALAVLLGACSVWAFAELLRGGTTRSLVAYAAATAALLYVQFVFLPLLLAQAIAWLLVCRLAPGTLPPRRAAIAFSAAILPALPLLPQILGVARRAGALTWPAKDEFPPQVYAFLQTTPLLTAVLVFLAAAWALGRSPLEARAGGGPEEEGRERRDALAVTLQYLLPLLLLGTLALRLPSLVKPRYAAAYLAPAALLLGWALTRPAWAAGRRLLAAAYLALILATQVIPEMRAGRPFNKDTQVEDWRGAARFVAEGRQPGDLVLLRAGLVETADLYRGAFPDACTPYLASPLSDFYLPGEGDLAVLPPEFAPPPYPSAYAERLAPSLEERRRIWLVMLNPPDPNGYLRAALTYVRDTTQLPFRPERSGNFGQVNAFLLTVDDTAR